MQRRSEALTARREGPSRDRQAAGGRRQAAGGRRQVRLERMRRRKSGDRVITMRGGLGRVVVLPRALMAGLARCQSIRIGNGPAFPVLGELWSISPVLADRKALCPGQAKPGAAPASLEKASLENASPVARTPPRQARPDQAHRHC